MYRISIKGLRFYGKYNEDHFKAIFKIAKVLDKDEISGIRGVYGTDGRVVTKANEQYSAGYYIRFTPLERSAHIILNLKYKDKTEENIDIYKSPIITIEGALCKTEYDFAFTLLHEIGHHITYDETDSEKDKEIKAHLFAIDKIRKIYPLDKITINCYTYLKEAIDIYKIKTNKF